MSLDRILQTDPSPETTPWKVHGWLGFFAWGVFVPVAIMASVFRRSLPADGVWFRIHSSLNGVAYLFTVVAVTIAVVYTQKEGNPHFNGPHKRMGLAMVLLASVQVLLGLLRPSKQNNKSDSNTTPDTDNTDTTTDTAQTAKSTRRVAFEASHRLLGASLLLCGVWQIYRGVHLYDFYYTLERSKLLYSLLGSWMVILAVAVIGIAMYQRCGSKQGDGASQSTSWRNDEAEPESGGVVPPSVS